MPCLALTKEHNYYKHLILTVKHGGRRMNAATGPEFAVIKIMINSNLYQNILENMNPSCPVVKVGFDRVCNGVQQVQQRKYLLPFV